MTNTARDAIVEAAFRLFLERGYKETTLARILESVPYSKGAVYHHFSNKEALLDAVVDRFFTGQLSARPLPRPQDAVSLAHQLADDYANAIEDVAPFATPLAYYAFLISVSERAQSSVRAAHENAIAALAEAFVTQGTLPAEASQIAGDIIALIEGTELLGALREDNVDRKQLHAAVDRMLALVSS